MPPIGRTASLLAALCLAVCALPAQADGIDPNELTYRLGDGLRLPGSNLTLGGYGTVVFEDLDDRRTRAALDNLSLFVWWESTGRWKFFAELDYENVLSSPTLKEPGNKRYLALERMYFDYALSDTTNLRLGKFLTPIGQWNQIHATPLVWTTSRPLVTARTVPTNVTGLMLSGNLPVLGGGMEYAVFGSNGGELRPNPSLDPFYESLGGRITLPLGASGQIGFSYARFEQKQDRDESKHLAGMDLRWSRDRWEVSAEAAYRSSEYGGEADEKGAFAQLVAPLNDKLYAVCRYELYRQAHERKTTKLLVTGLNYRITPAVVLKAEWISARDNQIDAPSGFMSSLSLMF
jgi:hypothetical protein